MVYPRMVRFSYFEGLETFRRLPVRMRIGIATASFLLVVGILGLVYLQYAQAFSGGTGTWDDPYIITDCTELQAIGSSQANLNASYVLGNDIDCSAVPNFAFIGSTDDVWAPFSGRFDGAGYTVSNVTLDYTSASATGVFGETTGAYIKNTVFDNITVTGGMYVGAVVGYQDNTALVGISVINSNVSSEGPTSSSFAGGVTGYLRDDSYIYDVSVSTTTVTVANGTGTSAAGGIVGAVSSGRIANAYSNASVSSGAVAGGIAGSLSNGRSEIRNAYSTGTTTGDTYVGGITGTGRGGPNGYEGSGIYSSYFAGVATTTNYGVAIIGGIVSRNMGTPGSEGYIGLHDNFAVGTVSKSGASDRGAIIGYLITGQIIMDNNVYYPTGTGLTRCVGNFIEGSFSASECASNNTSAYFNSSSNAPLSSWDFTNVWTTVSGNRPALRTLPYSPAVSATPIASCSALASALAANPDGWFSLSNNIDCAGDTSILPFSTTTGNYFTGRLDGNGHTIGGLSFSYAVPGTTDGGGFFGRVYGAIFTGITFTGTGITVSGTYADGAGIIGIGMGHPVLTGIQSSVPITGPESVGGLIGSGSSVHIEDSNVDADITSDGVVGGLVGEHDSYIVIKNSSYTGGTVTGNYEVGGLVGYAGGGLLEDVFSSGTLRSKGDYVGGFVGDFYSYVGDSSITNSSSTMWIEIDTSGTTYFSDIGGLTGETYDVNFLHTEYTGTIDLTGADNLENIGGLAGEIDGDGGIDYASTQFSIRNSTSTATILAPGGGNYSSIGGITGYVDETSGQGLVVDSVYASSTMVFGSGGTPVNGVDKVGLLIGNPESAIVSNSSTDGSITIIGSAGNFSNVNRIGLLVGQSDADSIDPSITGSRARGTISISSYTADYIGGLGGEADNTDITDTYASSTISITSPEVSYVGGFIGDAETVTTARSFADGSITIAGGQDGTSQLTYIGGFNGYHYQTTNSDTYTTTDISVTSDLTTGLAAQYLGGYAGGSNGTSMITNSYAAGSLAFSAPGGDATASDVGGFFGTSFSDDTYENSFAASELTMPAGTTNIGGFIGSYSGTETFTNNAYGSALTGQSLCSGTDGTDPAWCTDHATQADFFDSSIEPLVSWDFSSNWDVQTCTYPTLHFFNLLFGGVCGGGGGGGGATPPAVTTDSSPSGITETGATLGGSITDAGSASVTERGFTYGLTTDYGATTTESGSFSTGPFSAGVSGLTAATAYHFRSYALSSGGIGYGSDATFTTTAASGGGGAGGSGSSSHNRKNGSSVPLDSTPPVISNVNSTIDSGTVTITWHTNEPASSEVAYGPTSCLGLITPEADTGSAGTRKHVVVIPVAACNSSAHFSVISSDASGNRSINPGHSNAVQLCPASSLPPAPALLACTVPGIVPAPAPLPALPDQPARVPAIASEPSVSELLSTLISPQKVVINEGEPEAAGRNVAVDVTPPADAVSMVFSNPDVPSADRILPAAKMITTWDLCAGNQECAPGAHSVSVYFIDAQGNKTTPITTLVTLVETEQPAQASSSDASGLPRALFQPEALRQLSQEVNAASLSIAALGILWSFVSSLRPLSDLPGLIVRGFASLLPFGYLRRKGRPWGTVYDSKTRRPLDPAVVTLYDAAGKELKTHITDLDGRFGFLVDSGTYSLVAQKGFHSFPATSISAIDPVYPHPYTGGPIEVGSEGVIARDIPLDPTAFDWNESEKYRKGLYRFFSRFDRPLAYASLILTPIGALISVTEAIIAPNVLNSAFVVAYAVIGFLYVAGLKPRLYGLVRDSSGAPIAFALVRAFVPGTDTTTTKAVTDHLGRYYLLLPSGHSFDIQVETRASEDAEYVPVLRQRFDHLHGHFNTVLHL